MLVTNPAWKIKKVSYPRLCRCKYSVNNTHEKDHGQIVNNK